MPRDLATKGKMPSLTVVSIGKDKGPKAPPQGMTSQSDVGDMGKESYFKCPACGTQLCAEEKGESGAEHGEETAEQGMRGYGD